MKATGRTFPLLSLFTTTYLIACPSDDSDSDDATTQDGDGDSDECDGYPHGADGVDEADCGTFTYDDGEVIPSYLVCDWNTDCEDG